MAGRPLKFKTPEDLETAINEYFKSCFKTKETKIGRGKNAKIVNEKYQFRPFTITGLALALDTTRDTLIDYETKYSDEFSYTIKKAKLKCQNFAEESLFGNNVTGVIFNLKNNYGWKDKTEVEAYGKEGKDLFPPGDKEAENYAKWRLQQGLPIPVEPASTDESPADLGDGQSDGERKE